MAQARFGNKLSQMGQARLSLSGKMGACRPATTTTINGIKAAKDVSTEAGKSINNE